MGMARRSSSIRRRKPSFFKVLVGDFSTQLQLPPAFLVHFNGKVPQQTHLRNSAGTWRVNMKKVKDKVYFERGWKKFVHDNGLKLCEFLVFGYDGNLGFYVDIYGIDCCKKEFVMAVRKRESPHEEGHGNAVHRKSPRHHGKQNVDNQGLKGSAYGTRANQAVLPVKDEVADDTESEPLMHPLATNTRKAIAFQRDNGFESENPSFKVAMGYSYIHYYYLALPSKFVKAHLIEKPCDVTLRVSDGRTWPIKLEFEEDEDARCRFSGGWMAFVRDNNLKVGDVCVFFLINKIEFLFEAIFRRKT